MNFLVVPPQVVAIGVVFLGAIIMMCISGLISRCWSWRAFFIFVLVGIVSAGIVWVATIL